MRQSAHVVTPAAFDKWLAASEGQGGRRRGGAAGGGGGAAPDGKTIFTSTASPAAAPATRSPTRAPTGTIGPDLDKVLKGKDATFIQQSIEDPERR